MKRIAVLIVAAALAGCGSSVAATELPDALGDGLADDSMRGDSSALDEASVDDAGGADAASGDTTSSDVVDAPGSADGAKSPCPADMAALPTACMDRYEAPNIAGAKPLAMQTAIDGEAWCKARGKRLCTEAEWVRACNGVDKRPFPYGTTYVRGKCNDDKTWKSPDWTVLGTWPSAAAKAEADRLYQADPSGTRTGCVSEDDVVDLTGNVAEWVVRSFPNATNYDHVMKGCYWSGCYGGSPPSCSFVNPAHPGTFRSYEAGFRCCTSR